MRDVGQALKANRHIWDAAVRVHAASPFYNVEGFLKGQCTLSPMEVKEMGDVSGKYLVHLQCHFGLDTLSWARRGARATGVDFSPSAILKARELALRAGLDAQFVESEISEVPENLPVEFDIVYTGGGALCWLPDLDVWARVVVALLKPGGRLYLREFHPVMSMFSPEDADPARLRLEGAYFREAGPQVWTDGLRYASAEGPVGETVEWSHGLGEIIQALLGAGLRLTMLREHASVGYQSHAFLVKREGRWVHPSFPGGLPLTFSLQAVKP